MKIGIVGDIHWSKYSSILRSRGNKYSTRLENCIKSINWAEEELSDCDLIVYLGDFFDSCDLKSEELTALNELNWNSSRHIFIIGNHELGLNNLSFSSAHLFNITNIQVVNDLITAADGTELCFLSYKLDNSGRIEDYLPIKKESKRIIFSHNDIAGVQLGKFISKSGFDINNIESNCDLFINGHLHNGSKISDKIYNIGNLTGQNFSEDASIYTHNIFKLDTDTLNIEKIENPFALKFYKFDNIDNLLNYNFSSNSIVAAKLYSNEIDKAKEYLGKNKNVLVYRITSIYNKNESTDKEKISLTIDHLEKFQQFIIDELGTDNIVLEELQEILH